MPSPSSLRFAGRSVSSLRGLAFLALSEPLSSLLPTSTLMCSCELDAERDPLLDIGRSRNPSNRSSPSSVVSLLLFLSVRGRALSPLAGDSGDESESDDSSSPADEECTRRSDDDRDEAMLLFFLVAVHRSESVPEPPLKFFLVWLTSSLRSIMRPPFFLLPSLSSRSSSVPPPVRCSLFVLSLTIALASSPLSVVTALGRGEGGSVAGGSPSVSGLLPFRFLRSILFARAQRVADGGVAITLGERQQDVSGIRATFTALRRYAIKELII